VTLRNGQRAALINTEQRMVFVGSDLPMSRCPGCARETTLRASERSGVVRCAMVGTEVALCFVRASDLVAPDVDVIAEQGQWLP
jgi:hypothetical protein